MAEREKTKAYRHRPFPSKIALKGRSTNKMIRLFTALCKSMSGIIKEEAAFQEATEGYRHYGEACPSCGAMGKLSPYGHYSRSVVYYKINKTVINFWVEALRFKCKLCGKTHAVLPDIVIPYSPYSLSFMLTVLMAYYERETTVINICEHFQIAVSTLYEWKKRMASHKELMLGILISRKTSALAFLKTLLEGDGPSNQLRQFFCKYGFSFMQRKPASATQRRPP